MALPFTPHAVTVQSVSQNKGTDKRNDSLSYATGTVLNGMIGATDPSDMFNTWGIETNKPHKLYLNVADASGIKIGDKITFGARAFIVRAPVKLNVQGLLTDHAVALLEEIT